MCSIFVFYSFSQIPLPPEYFSEYISVFFNSVSYKPSAIKNRDHTRTVLHITSDSFATRFVAQVCFVSLKKNECTRCTILLVFRDLSSSSKLDIL